MSGKNTYRTPLSRVRNLGSAHSGTMHFWRQRLTSVALIPLSIAFICHRDRAARPQSRRPPCKSSARR